MKYRNLDLEAFDYKRTDDGAEQFRVRVADSPAGQQSLEEAATAPLPAGLRPQLQFLEQRSLSLTALIRLGVMLADALFPPAVRAFVERSRERLDDDEGLRIRLKLNTYALADLPWEYAYLPQPGTPANYRGQDGFLVLDRRISLVRYELLGQAPGSLDPVDADSLRMAVLMANPQLPGVPALNLAAEEQHIIQAIGGLAGLQVQFYCNATLDMLQDALVRETHIFHFAGHGTFDLKLTAASGGIEGKGFLLFMDESDGVVYLPAEKLAVNLRGRGVRLAVLGACQASRRDNVNPWTGIAPALTRAGIPAVIGMQYTIDDANAIAFSRRFYRGLAAGQPIDAAVSDGRLAIFNRGGESEQDWGVPVLYLRAEEGVLFPRPVGGTFPPAGPRPTSADNGSLSRSAGFTGTGDGRLVIPPRVIATVPANGATGVSHSLVAVRITFDKDMQDDKHGLKSGPGGAFGLVNARVKYDVPTRTFTVTRDNAAVPLPPNTLIYFDVNVPASPDDFMDLAGVRAEPIRFSFTTEGSAPELPPAVVDKRALREAIIPAFSAEELRILCSDVQESLARDGVTLQVDPEIAGGSGKPAQVLNLIQYLDRRGYLSYLVAAVRAARPGII
ncbi:MAG: CHAT domain-containing protein [Chloroflexi bacterium]|nr:CHAT domain-containing protein [Chloroflexota bacterium]